MPKPLPLPAAPDPVLLGVMDGLPSVFKNRTEIAQQLLDFAVEANKAVEAATRLEVKDQASFDAATDVASSIRRVMAKIEPARKAYTDPLERAKKKLITLFGAPAERMQDSLDAIRRKMTTWRDAEQARQRKEAEAQRAAEAAEAQRLADAAKAMGDKAGAAQIREEAAIRAAAPIEVKVTGTGSFGGKTVDSKRPVGEVTDRFAFLHWALHTATAGPGEAARIIAGIEFGKSGLNALAKELLEAAEPATIPGFSYKYDTNLNFR